jgi:alginate O-acetyltransferase complex protein AlgI
MLFNSIAFLLFLPIVFLLYWQVAGRSLRWQNVLLLVASYVFYGWWDYRFLGLIVLSSAVDFALGLQLAKKKSLSISG